MDYQIREIRESEYAILSDFLYEAIFIPEGADKPLTSVIKQASLSVQKANYAVYMYKKQGLKQLMKMKKNI